LATKIMSDLKLEIRILTMRNAADRQSTVQRTIASSHSLSRRNHAFFFAASPDDVELEYDDYKAYVNSRRTLSPAERSCYASHYGICLDFLNNTDAEFLFVMEDDVYIDPYFNFEDAVEMMSDADMDYLRLFCRAHAPAHTIVYEGKYQIVRYNWSPGGTQAYLLSRRGARNLADHIRAEKIISRPIDIEMDRSWATKNAVFAIFPQPALEFNFPTTIHSKEQIEKRATSDANISQWKHDKSLKSKLHIKYADYNEKLLRKINDHNNSKSDTATREKIIKFLRKNMFFPFQSRGNQA
jgi:glycosyl transferase family 25